MVGRLVTPTAEGLDDGVPVEGTMLGTSEAVADGVPEGDMDGPSEARTVGAVVEGTLDGMSEPRAEGEAEGSADGIGVEGTAEGITVGRLDGMSEAVTEGRLEAVTEGRLEGWLLGVLVVTVGLLDGKRVVGMDDGMDDDKTDGGLLGSGMVVGTVEEAGTRTGAFVVPASTGAFVVLATDGAFVVPVATGAFVVPAATGALVAGALVTAAVGFDDVMTVGKEDCAKTICTPLLPLDSTITMDNNHHCILHKQLLLL